MSWKRAHRLAPRLELLEDRFELSTVFPANSIGIAQGSVLQPRGVSSATVTVAAKNLTAGRSSTLFGIFVGPAAGSSLAPRIVGVEAGDGSKLPLKQGRPFLPGRADGQAAAFVQVSHAGPLTILVSGGHRSTGGYTVDVTLHGDVNGDGTVNQSDLAPFALAYGSSVGGKDYNAAADFNQDGIVNQIDAKALEENMPVPNRNPLNLQMYLLPADSAHYRTPQNSGGATFKKDVVVVGRTVPGSIAIQDGTSGFFKWVGPAYATDANGYFTAKETLTQGINTFDFLIIDPLGRQLIRSFPIYWLPFAASGSKLK